MDKETIKIHFQTVSPFNIAPTSIKYLEINVLEVCKVPMSNCQKIMKKN